VLLYNSDIERDAGEAMLEVCESAPRRENILLILCTRGGDPDAAYRMVRWLQGLYKKVTVFVCGRCKSAGTLLALGAHEIVMTDEAEIGPLDIQLGKKDELFEMDSGLTVLNALAQLEDKAFDLFESAFLRLKLKSEGRITLRMATQIAGELATGMMTPILSQIDPLHVGEVSRAMEIGRQYGLRLSKYSKNLRPHALDRLVDEYPSHGFVIDREEAKELFFKVRGPTEKELELAQLLGAPARHPSKAGAILTFLSNPKQEQTHDNRDHETGLGEPATAAAAADGSNVAASNDPQKESGSRVAAFAG